MHCTVLHCTVLCTVYTVLHFNVLSTLHYTAGCCTEVPLSRQIKACRVLTAKWPNESQTLVQCSTIE